MGDMPENSAPLYHGTVTLDLEHLIPTVHPVQKNFFTKFQTYVTFKLNFHPVHFC